MGAVLPMQDAALSLTRPRVKASTFGSMLAAAILVPLGIFLLAAWLAWGQVWRQTEAELARTADAAAEYAARLLDGHALLADRVDDLLDTMPDAEVREQEGRLHAALRRMTETRPSVLTLYAIDAEGYPLVSANLHPVPRGRSLADRDFFEALRAGETAGRFISKVYRGRFDGELFFSVAHQRGAAILHPDGASRPAAFRGVVMVSLRPGEVGAGLSQFTSKPGDLINLVRSDGEILARSTGFSSQPHPLPADSPMRPTMAAGAERGTSYGSPAMSGVAGIAAFRRVAGWPVYAGVVRPRAAVIGEWQSAIMWQGAFAGPAVLGLVGLVLLAFRRSREAVEARASLRMEAERRLAAEALAHSEARLQRALAAGHVFAFEWNPTTDEVVRSANCGPILGFEEEGAAIRDNGRNFFSHIHPEDRDRFVATATGATPAKPGYAIRYRYRCPDGRFVWLEEAATARFSPDGRLAHLSGLARDVTVEVKAEEALRESEARLRLAQEAGGVGSWDWDLLRNVVTCSEAYCRLYGLDPDGPGHQDFDAWLAQVHPDDRDRTAAAARTGITAGHYDVEFRILRPDGSLRWVVGRARTRFDAEGRPVRFFGVNVDITALREAEHKLRLAAEGAGLGIYEMDLMRGAVSLDARAVALTEGTLPPGTWVPMNGPAYAAYLERVHPEDRTAREAANAAIAGGMRPHVSQEYRVRRADGSWGWLWVHGTAMERDPVSGRPRRITGIIQDTTEQHRLAEELRQSQKLQALGELAGGIAHDFNNILQAVLGGAALIERRAEDIEGVRQRARMLKEAAERGASITRRLLAFARRGELHVTAVDPVALLASVQEILGPSLGSGIAIRAEVPPGLPAILADKGQLETALINLATNARDAMPWGGTLTVSAVEERVAEGETPSPPVKLAPGRYVRFSVRDSGEGMDTATLTRVFEPFFTTKPLGKGTGLGLPMVKGFAEQSGGGFAIESAPGQGTQVSLWLPVALNEAAVAAPPPSTAQDAAPAKAHRVLVVDDEPAVRGLIAAGLELAGYRILTAGDGAEALKLLEAGEVVDLMVTDLTMPGLDGLTLIRAARARHPRLPVILLTGYAGDAAALEPGTAEGAPFVLLRKPVTETHLAERVASLLGPAAEQPVQQAILAM